ncbi:MAG: hypothetical protein IT158_24345 [Bryobacterales bacterium]|nr:hypothetical protein [Bryobacterales bacterium]
MKLVASDQTLVYFVCDRPDGRSHGIRIGRGTGAVGFVSDTPADQPSHPVCFTDYDNAISIPVSGDLPPILASALADIDDAHPEIHALLTGRMRFEDA